MQTKEPHLKASLQDFSCLYRCATFGPFGRVVCVFQAIIKCLTHTLLWKRHLGPLLVVHRQNITYPPIVKLCTSLSTSSSKKGSLSVCFIVTVLLSDLRYAMQSKKLTSYIPCHMYVFMNVSICTYIHASMS